MIPDRSICAKSAQQYANPQRREQTRCQSAAHGRAMGKIITIRFRRSRLPRRLVAILVPARPRWRVALISAAIAVGVELFRLVHAPWLDAFRLTMAGVLLLGRIFSAWDMLAYGVGIGLGVLLDGLALSAFCGQLRRHAGAR
jgi:hypothetical protein